VTDAPEPIFFEDPDALRDWFAEHAGSETELWIGLWKKHTGRAKLTWTLAVDEALCVGWIDGVMRRIDDERHMQRFTPRKRGSNWSAVNIKKVAKLEAEGRMQPAGRAAFEARSEERSAIYSYERETAKFTPEQKAQLRASPEALADFESRAPSYQRTATYWVTSAKREETRARRLAQLIEDHGAGRLLKQYRWSSKPEDR
jgi:uncharacterized protein YdeI (YjbR/CyaY-like superfamily)